MELHQRLLSQKFRREPKRIWSVTVEGPAIHPLVHVLARLTSTAVTGKELQVTLATVDTTPSLLLPVPPPLVAATVPAVVPLITTAHALRDSLDQHAPFVRALTAKPGSMSPLQPIRPMPQQSARIEVFAIGQLEFARASQALQASRARTCGVQLTAATGRVTAGESACR